MFLQKVIFILEMYSYTEYLFIVIIYKLKQNSCKQILNFEILYH